jgi:hypothetical protein
MAQFGWSIERSNNKLLFSKKAHKPSVATTHLPHGKGKGSHRYNWVTARACCKGGDVRSYPQDLQWCRPSLFATTSLPCSSSGSG